MSDAMFVMALQPYQVTVKGGTGDGVTIPVWGEEELGKLTSILGRAGMEFAVHRLRSPLASQNPTLEKPND